MFCKFCGKEVEDSARFCPGCGKDLSGSAFSPEIEEPKKKKKKKKKHPILGGILLIIGIIIIIGVIGGSKEPQKVDTSSPAATQAAAETTAPAVFSVGDTLEKGDILVTLNDVSESSGSQFFSPTDGNVFVTCEFTIENNSSSELAVSSIMSFECYFDDYAANISLGAMTAEQSTQLDGSVAPGKKISGVVGYEAPADWSEMEIHFKSSPYATKPFIFNYSK